MGAGVLLFMLLANYSHLLSVDERKALGWEPVIDKKKESLPMMDVDPNENPLDFWNGLYSSKDKVWSGKVNQTLAAAVAGLTPGTSLDLGCGEGGDVLWLAEQGWVATGFEISDVAVERARAEARARGLEAKTSFRNQNIQDWEPAGEVFDLVTASFFQSPVFLARDEIVQKAAGQLAPGGHLVLISHAGPPSWYEGEAPKHFISPADEIKNLNLESEGWELVRAELVTRHILSPEGQPATIEDCLVVARRLA